MIQPLMPKATAVWLVENTALTFDQVADFCGLHVLEVQRHRRRRRGAGTSRGADPGGVNGQLTRAEIERWPAGPGTTTPTACRLIQNPADPDAQGPALHARFAPPGPPGRDRLAAAQPPGTARTRRSPARGTTKPTIESVRDRSHWNSAQHQAGRSGDPRASHGQLSPGRGGAGRPPDKAEGEGTKRQEGRAHHRNAAAGKRNRAPARRTDCTRPSPRRKRSRKTRNARAMTPTAFSRS